MPGHPLNGALNLGMCYCLTCAKTLCSGKPYAQKKVKKPGACDGATARRKIWNLITLQSIRMPYSKPLPALSPTLSVEECIHVAIFSESASCVFENLTVPFQAWPPNVPCALRFSHLHCAWLEHTLSNDMVIAAADINCCFSKTLLAGLASARLNTVAFETRLM